jgi:conjugative relaxase-like TrwC/TraI family protein
LLSIGKLVTGAEDYYLSTVAQGREEYYTGAGEAPGVWFGQGTSELGLSGAVDPDHLRAVLAGRHPLAGTDLTTGRVDSRRRVAGFDCTLSAPKSVSVLWALGGTSRQAGTATTAAAVRRAHDRAVGEAVRYLEAHALAARRGTGGEERIGTSGMVAAAFRHRTSRAGDPQLHTHVLAANLCQGSDGRWSAPDARLLYFHARAAGFVYQAALRVELVGSLGLRFGPVSRGVAEVQGIPEALLRAFSTRRADIEAALERHGASGARAAEIAALDTRRAKSDPTGADRSLHDRWCEQAAALAIDPHVAERVAGPPRLPSLPLDQGESLAADLLAPTGLTAQVSAFERRDVVRAVAERLPDGGHLGRIEELTEMILTDPGVVRLRGEGSGGEGRSTTVELLATESRLLSAAESRRNDAVAVVPDAVRCRVPGLDRLSGEQRAMVEQLTTSGRGVEVVVGKAGAGKTTALAAARRAWEAAGYSVSGTALSARAAAGLEEGAGIPSVTVSRLLGPAGHGEGRDPSVLVVDEAGMVGTRDLDRLLTAAGEAGAKVVLVGDPRQLPEIAAGGAFGALARRLGAVELTGNRRQVEPWERAVLDELRHGDVARGLVTYHAHERIHGAPTMADAREQLVADWLAARREGGEIRMLAATRREVDELNALARTALNRRGLLGSVVAETGGRDFALGDRVVCLRNDRRIGVLNGTRATVVAGGDAGGLTVLAGDQLRHLPATYLTDGHLAHGYATTVHKSQGETVDRAFVLGGDGLFREAGYVALSRARTRTDLYVPEGAFEDGLAPDTGPLPGLTRVLSTSRAKSLAHEDERQLATIRRFLAADPRSDDQRANEPEGWARERTFNARDLGMGR